MFNILSRVLKVSSSCNVLCKFSKLLVGYLAIIAKIHLFHVDVSESLKVSVVIHNQLLHDACELLLFDKASLVFVDCVKDFLG